VTTLLTFATILAGLLATALFHFDSRAWARRELGGAR
jgi:hypothetical protein